MLGRTTGLDRRRATPSLDARYTAGVGGEYPIHGVLVITGSRRRRQGEARRYQHMEIDYGPFERRVQLGDAVDADRAEARYERGQLTVVLPLAERPAGPVRLNVTTGGQA